MPYMLAAYRYRPIYFYMLWASNGFEVVLTKWLHFVCHQYNVP